MDQESIRTLVRYGVNLIWTCAADDKTKMENMLIIQLLIFHTCFNATVDILIKQKIWSTERASKIWLLIGQLTCFQSFDFWNSKKGRFEPVSNCGFYNENCAHPNLKITDKNITDPTEQWIDRAFQVYSQIDQVTSILLQYLLKLRKHRLIGYFSRIRTLKSIFFAKQKEHEEVPRNLSELLMNIWMAMDQNHHFPRMISLITFFTNAMNATVDAISVSLKFEIMSQNIWFILKLRTVMECTRIHALVQRLKKNGLGATSVLVRAYD